MASLNSLANALKSSSSSKESSNSFADSFANSFNSGSSFKESFDSYQDNNSLKETLSGGGYSTLEDKHTLNGSLSDALNNKGNFSTLEDKHTLNGSLSDALNDKGYFSTLEDKHTLNGSLDDYIKGRDGVIHETLPERIQIGPDGEIIRDDVIIETLPERVQIGPNGEIIRDGGETKVIEYSSFQNKLTDENFNKLSDAEVKEKMKDLYFKEGLNEEQVKNKLKETEKLSSSELKEKFKEQYNKASVNGLINSSNASFITGGAVGLVSGGERMSITISEIPFIVSKLRSCESRVREIWSDLLNTYINQIENSWAGPDAQAYIEKVRGYNTKVEKSAQALSLLADTYEKVMTSSQDTQQKVMHAVNEYF